MEHVVTISFWKDAAERAIKTGVQTLTAFLGADVTVFSIDWSMAGQITATAMAVSLLTSLASSRVHDRSASLVSSTREV